MAGRPMPQLGDWGGTGGSSSSYSPVGGSKIPSNIFAGLAPPEANPYQQQNQASMAPPAPSYTPPQEPYYAPQQQIASGSFGIGAPDSGGYGGGGSPEPQPKPVMSESDWLAGDGEYQDQMGQFESSLQDFLARLTTEKSDFTADYNTANTGLGRNRKQGMLSQGEDFTSRGLANSGLFNNAQNELGAQFDTQQNGLNSAKDRAFAGFTNQESDKRKSTDQAKGNAKRGSLGRMAMDQAF